MSGIEVIVDNAWSLLLTIDSGERQTVGLIVGRSHRRDADRRGSGRFTQRMCAQSVWAVRGSPSQSGLFQKQSGYRAMAGKSERAKRDATGSAT